MTDGMIFKDELRRHRCAEAERERSGTIQFLVGEGSDLGSGCFAVLAQKFDRLVLWPNWRCHGGMFGVDFGYDVPSHIGDDFCRTRRPARRSISMGYMLAT